jgi:hypothetical protein
MMGTREKAFEERFEANKKFMEWARKEIADSVIKFGFSELNVLVVRILQEYRAFEENHPLPKD